MTKAQKGYYPLKVSIKEYPEFSDRLKEAMRIRECSVNELASVTFVTKSTICGYRSGQRSPNLATLKLIAKNLDVSSDFLIGLKEEILI